MRDKRIQIWNFVNINEELKIKKIDKVYSPINNKWIIEDGGQIAGWELELKWKDDKMLKNI